MADAEREVFVPSVEQGDSVVVALGIFSEEKIAMSVLKDFLKRTEQMDLVSAEMTRWVIDIIGHEGSSLLFRMANRMCPVCERNTFWIDLVSFNAMCYGSGCGAWIEDNIHQEEIIDCGWPPMRFLHQSPTVESAMTELGKMGARLKAAGQASSALAARAFLEEYGEDGALTEEVLAKMGDPTLADTAEGN